MILVSLLAAAGVPGSITLSIAMGSFWLTCCLWEAATDAPRLKQTWLLFAVLLRLSFAAGTCFTGYHFARATKNKKVVKTFSFCAVVSSVAWFFFPFSWVLCEGHHSLSVDSEAIVYSAFDIISKPIFSALLLAGHRHINPTVLGFHIYDYDGWFDWKLAENERGAEDMTTEAIEMTHLNELGKPARLSLEALVDVQAETEAEALSAVTTEAEEEAKAEDKAEIPTEGLDDIEAATEPQSPTEGSDNENKLENQTPTPRRKKSNRKKKNTNK